MGKVSNGEGPARYGEVGSLEIMPNRPEAVAQLIREVGSRDAETDEQREHLRVGR